MAASIYHITSKEVENCKFRDTRIFRQAYIYKQPFWTSSGAIAF